jgi:hypothetical protein
VPDTSSRPAVSLPQPVWLILLALALGLGHGLPAPVLIKNFGAGFGRALGDFALILIPSFVLAACPARQALGGAPRVASVLAPLTAAGMVCPDTAYAALSSVAKHRKLSVAFGSHAGYRLLFPAGPLIVATGLGLDDWPAAARAGPTAPGLAGRRGVGALAQPLAGRARRARCAVTVRCPAAGAVAAAGTGGAADSRPAAQTRRHLAA